MPDKVEITSAKGAGKTKMDNLIIQDTDTLHVFDRANFDYQKFDDYCNAGILFLSRLKSNAKIKVLKSETVIIDGQEAKDSTVLLGDKKQEKQMDNILRILEIPDRENPGSTVRLITDAFEHSAALISFVLLTLLKKEAKTDKSLFKVLKYFRACKLRV